jgi:hypothetical protein
MFAIEVLVRYARQFVDRCVLFVVRRGIATPRHAHGWSIEPLRVELSEPGILGDASRRGSGSVMPVGFDGSDLELRARIGIGDSQVLVVPMAIRGRTVALLVGADERADVEAESASEITSFCHDVAAALARIILAHKH